SAPRPAIEPAFAARTYTPVRIALLPPDVFMVVDEVGDNDPARSEALRQQVIAEVVKFSSDAFRRRGYDLDLSARWDGIFAADGQPLVTGDELSGMAQAILQFANGPDGGRVGPLTTPQIIAPELAAKLGWATRSDSLLYVNLKGVTTSNGKRAAAIAAVALIVVILALIVLSEAKGHGGGPSHGPSTGAPGRVVAGPTMRGAPGARGVAMTPPRTGGASLMGARPAPVGRGPTRWAPGPSPRYYGGGPHVGVGVGVFVPIPLEGPAYTHDGQVAHEDGLFGDDQVYLSMTLVNATDGRVLWHLRQDFDVEADNPADLQALVEKVVGSIPMRGDLPDPAAAQAK
ncbi:MAG TPA: hypothetical protein VHU40_00005, partial [Polyangia bacterium]|nr:hypothetical protein [Polyangia bacterium]